ncbi:MAG: hypothetical protein QOJ67_3142 [Acidimicrobiaceae bacterium]|jgi:serine phosphatase RsbU (regulator of sigma subunit)
MSITLHVGPLRFAAASMPFDADTGATGDWHDVIALPNGDVAVVVGDAVGHGAAAVPLKNCLQSALRQMARAGMTPEQILASVRELIEPLDDGFATLLYGVITGSGAMSFTNAGHPPPLLVDERGDVQFLEGGNGPLLGSPAPWPLPAEGRARIRNGQTLVLYTDGLIEGTDRDVDLGLGRLATTAGQHANAPLSDVCELLLSLAGNAPSVDGATAMAVRWNEPQIFICAAPSGRAPQRSALTNNPQNGGTNDGKGSRNRPGNDELGHRRHGGRTANRHPER